MQCEITNRFKKDYRALDKKKQKKVDEAIISLLEKRFHPGLRTKKLQGVKKPWSGKVWEARTDGSFRITYHIEDDKLILRRCGTHSIYEQP
jgi:addiction module RelE/StbE family toxin